MKSRSANATTSCAITLAPTQSFFSWLRGYIQCYSVVIPSSVLMVLSRWWLGLLNAKYTLSLRIYLSNQQDFLLGICSSKAHTFHPHLPSWDADFPTFLLSCKDVYWALWFWKSPVLSWTYCFLLPPPRLPQILQIKPNFTPEKKKKLHIIKIISLFVHVLFE